MATGHGAFQHAHDVGRPDTASLHDEHPGRGVLPEVAHGAPSMAQPHRGLCRGESTYDVEMGLYSRFVPSEIQKSVEKS